VHRAGDAGGDWLTGIAATTLQEQANGDQRRRQQWP